MTPSNPSPDTGAGTPLTATLRPGRDLTGLHVLVVWVRLDLGAGPEWVAVGTVRGGWR